MIFIKSKVPAMVNIKAIIILTMLELSLKNIIETSIPSFAHSIIPAVVGDTNLLLVILCIISPAILKLAPVIKIPASLGIRLIIASLMSSSLPFKSSKNVNSFTPILSEMSEKIISKKSNIYEVLLKFYPIIQKPQIWGLGVNMKLLLKFIANCSFYVSARFWVSVS